MKIMMPVSTQKRDPTKAMVTAKEIPPRLAVMQGRGKAIPGC